MFMMRLYVVVSLVSVLAHPRALAEEADASESVEVVSALAGETVESMLAAVHTPASETWRGTLVEALTGSIVIAQRGNAAVKLRLYGVDSPEPGQPGHNEAKAYITERFAGADVDVHLLTVDSQQNPVALVFDAQGNSLSHVLVAEGLVWWDTRNAGKDKLLRGLNADAIIAEAGVYAHVSALAPWDYRDSRRLPQFTYTLYQEEGRVVAAAEPTPDEPVTLTSENATVPRRQREPELPPPSAPKPSFDPRDVDTKDINLPNLMMRHQPRIAQDDSGRPLGLTATDIGAIPFAAQLGFRDGDIVSRVNGIAIESEAQIMGLIPQFEGVKQFQVEVVRNGQPVVIPITVP